MVMVWVPSLPGTSYGAWVGKFEVTQKEFQKVMDSNPSKSKDPAHPVESVTWQEALDFCGKLTASEKAAGTLPSGFVYALPTQAQWDFFLSDAKFDDGVTSRTCTPLRESPVNVGTLPPNQLGLYDVLGNVWEWCSDTGTNADRFLKGSAFNSTTHLYFGKTLDRTTPRRLAADSRSPEVGFRCILAPAP
jgi:formylglycine-generating enzyme required for sulfatase activity